MLIGVDRQRSDDFRYTYLIHGADKQPNIDEFLARLIQFKDRFDLSEEEYERQLKIPKHNFNYSSMYHNNYQQMHSANYLMSLLDINPNDGDNEDDDDDDDDDDERTPTVNRPSLKFP